MSEKELYPKTIAIIAYLHLIGAIIALFMNLENKNSFASFHIRQGLGLSLTQILCGYFIGYFNSFMITFSFWIFVSILWFYGFWHAINNQMKPIPLLGNYFQKIFNKV